MFTILGSDGKEYGPVTATKIAEWIAGGRANLQTQARRAEETEWRTLADFVEFNPAATPPPLPAAVPVPAQAASAPQIVPDEELADRGIRLGAFVIDYILSVLATLPGFLILGPTFFSIFVTAASGQQPDFSALQAGSLMSGLLVLALGSLILLVIQVVMLSTRGQTIGKRMLGIRVVRHPDGSQAGFLHAWLLRNFVPFLIQLVPWIGFAFWIVDSCFIFTQERRCLHDLIAGTKVVKA
jgi:uncharacterized RDD family membrane protein YckC